MYETKFNSKTGVHTVVMPCQDVEEFLDFLHRIKARYSHRDGSDMNTREVEFSGHVYQVIDALKWLEMHEKDIRACPFCGGVSGIRYEQRSGGRGEYYKTAHVECESCGARSKSYVCDGYYGMTTTEQDAIIAWNKRF